MSREQRVKNSERKIEAAYLYALENILSDYYGKFVDALKRSEASHAIYIAGSNKLNKGDS